MAVLTLPAVAASHLASQVPGLLRQRNNAPPPGSDDWEYLQSIAAAEAPFNVTETFMAISVVLFIAAAWMYCIRRAVVVALVGLVCFSVECYIHFSKFMQLGLRHYPAFSRLFVADFASLVIAILVTLAVCGLISAAIALFILIPVRTPSLCPQQDPERVDGAPPREQVPFRSIASTVEATSRADAIHGTRSPGRSKDLPLRAITMVTTLFLPISFISSLLPIFWHRSEHQATPAGPSFWHILDQSAARLGRDLFPRTACSITDLDQAVAAAAGVTVLAFNIYSVAKAYYQIWHARKTPASDLTAFELNGIENVPAL